MTVLFDPEIRAEEFRGRRVTIVGLGKGRTTAGLARFLVAKGAQVTIADRMPREELREGIERLGDVPATLVLGPSSDDIAPVRSTSSPPCGAIRFGFVAMLIP